MISNRKDKKIHQKYRKGHKFGSWELKNRLGSGGNGEVWQVSRPGYADHAIKLLKSIDKISYERFKAEISVLSELGGVSGIIPLIDKDLPSSHSDRIPWFIMPISEKFTDYRKGKSPEQIVEDFVSLSETLNFLHKRRITHRDIKPANILYKDGILCFCDFGLVKYPLRTELTPKKEDVGAKFTMAPEMRRYASEADGAQADVYSFSKTLWIALTNQITGFDGQYNATSILGLKNFLTRQYTTTLDQLITECTDNDPNKRPSMERVTFRLREWLSLVRDFHRRNLTEWIEVENILFPTGAPERASWIKIDAICGVLHEIAKVPALNHMFYPNGGGNTITGVSRAAEPGTIALHVGGKNAEIIKPSKLTYESFGLDACWNYFRLEVAPTHPTGVAGAIDSYGISETLTELKPGHYVSYSHWDNSEYKGENLPEFSRPVNRFLNGSFVFFSTRSIYNGDSSTYDARHNKMTEEMFRDYINKNAINDISTIACALK